MELHRPRKVVFLEKLMANHIDHTRGLCNVSDTPDDTPRDSLDRFPAYCRCCGEVMDVITLTPEELEHSETTYRFECPNCPTPKKEQSKKTAP